MGKYKNSHFYEQSWQLNAFFSINPTKTEASHPK
jgi:hypothetical protein